MQQTVTSQPLTRHVTRLIVPTPTLPPAFHTNSYFIHDSDACLLVDAGTKDDSILNQIIEFVRQQNVRDIRLAATHYHRDHTHGLDILANTFQAPIYVHSDDHEGTRHELTSTNLQLLAIPPAFRIGSVTVSVQPLPGHTHGHVHLFVEQDGVMLVGDHLAGEGSVWIGPPDGHLDDYLQALDAIAASGAQVAAPGHGDPLVPAAAAAEQLKQRRLKREAQIEALIADAPRSQHDIVTTLYGDSVPEAALWVARRTVQGHLQRLIRLGTVKRTFDAEHEVFLYSSSV